MTIVLPTGALNLTASSTTPPVGENLTLTATFTDVTVAVTGTVTFKTEKKTLGVSPVINGRFATFITKDLELGPHTITASYSGDPNYPAMTAPTLTVTVKPPTPTVSETPITVNYGSGGRLTCRAPSARIRPAWISSRRLPMAP